MRSVAAMLVGLLVGLTTYETFCASAQADGSPTATEKTARIALVQEFVRDMVIIYRLQEAAKIELASPKNSSTAGKLTTSISVGARTLSEMQESVSRLDMIGIDTRWGEIRDLLKSFHNQRIAALQEMNQMSKAMLSSSEPGVNDGAMTELTARIEQIDKSMLQMSQDLFFALVDEGRVEADGSLHHLILNKKDRADTVHIIDTAFGRSLDDENATSVVKAARATKYELTRPNYKAADEP